MSIAGEVQPPNPKSVQQLLLISNEASTAAVFPLPGLDKLQGKLPDAFFSFFCKKRVYKQHFCYKKSWLTLAHFCSVRLPLAYPTTLSLIPQRFFTVPSEWIFFFMFTSLVPVTMVTFYRSAKMSLSPIPVYVKLGQLFVYFIITCLLNANTRLLQVQVLGNQVGAHGHVLRPWGKMIRTNISNK